MKKIAILGAVVVLISRTSAGADDYAFEAVQSEIRASNVAVLAVRLVNKTTNTSGIEF